MKKKTNIFLVILTIFCFFSLNNNVYAGEVKSIKITNNPKTMKVGEKNTFNVNVNMGSGSDFEEEIIWKSSDSSIASVTKKGDKKAEVVGVAEGYVTISACISNYKDLCSGVLVNVGSAKGGRVRQIWVVDNEYKLNPGQNENIKIEVEMNGATSFNGGNQEDDMINWTSSNKNVAVVVWKSEQHAVVTALSPGVAIIKGCVGKQPGVCTSTKIVVKELSKITSEHEDRVKTIEISSFKANMKVGESDKIQISMSDEDWNSGINEDKINIVESVSNTGDAIKLSKIDKNTFIVYGNKEGVAKVKFCLSTKPTVCTEEKTITISGSVTGMNKNGDSVAAPAESSDLDVNYDPNKSFNCQGLISDDLENVITWVMSIVRIAVPIILLVLCTLDFSQVVLSGDQDAMKKATSKVMKRAIAALGFFLVPTLINLSISWIESDYFENEQADCLEVIKNDDDV